MTSRPDHGPDPTHIALTAGYLTYTLGGTRAPVASPTCARLVRQHPDRHLAIQAAFTRGFDLAADDAVTAAFLHDRTHA